MFNASNLNDLYSRFDRKCFLALNGLSPLFITTPNGENYEQTTVPFGVVYQYRRDPSTCRRLGGSQFYSGSVIVNDYNQSKAYDELSKLEVKFQDVAGGQVYVDTFGPVAPSFTCDVASIHYSFELLTKEVDGKRYDVHLGYDPTSNLQTSYVSGSLGFFPRLPPSRIHKHKTAVADIFIEGYLEFSIKNTYQRYDCWRVHNCNASKLTVQLQSSGGSSTSVIIEPSSCRSFRRSPDGDWITTWPNGSVCRYFFPYLFGDVPYFAGGPPAAVNYSQIGFMAIEISARANNIANPFLLFQWQNAMYAQLDPRNQHSILSAYKGAYQDPLKDSTIIGNAIFTWGRAKVAKLKAGVIIQEYFKTFSRMETLVEDLESIGLTVTKAQGALTLVPKEQNTTVLIFPVDANIFVGGTGSTSENNRFWNIIPTGIVVATYYPNGFANYTTYNTSAWNSAFVPDLFDTILTLRKLVADQEGFYATIEDVPTEVPESIVSKVTLTPIGLVCCGVSANVITYNYTRHRNYEEAATSANLFTQTKQSGVRLVTPVHTYLFHAAGTWYENVMPKVGIAFVPPRGPWGFASSVYDAELSRVLNVTTGGADFWINKWGAANGKDNQVRILGQPNQTLQTPIQTTTQTPNLVADDVFYDLDNPKMAGVAGVTTLGGIYNLTQINYRDTEQYFNLPYIPSFVSQTGGTGPIFHKIKKSAWLWNSLEYAVNAWTRSIPMCMGNKNAPIFGGATLRSIIDVENLSSDNSSGRIAFGINESIYSQLLTNGILAYKQNAAPPSISTYYYVAPEDLESYCKRFGFNSYNFDAFKDLYSLTQDTIPFRSYSEGEKTDSVEYFRQNLQFPDFPARYYGSLRYVDLTA
jgi:hypothetical protein